MGEMKISGYFHTCLELDRYIRSKCWNIRKHLHWLEYYHSKYGFPARLNTAMLSYRDHTCGRKILSKFEDNVHYVQNIKTKEFIPATPVELFLCNIVLGNSPSFMEFFTSGITDCDILTYFLENMRGISGNAFVYDLMWLNKRY